MCNVHFLFGQVAGAVGQMSDGVYAEEGQTPEDNVRKLKVSTVSACTVSHTHTNTHTHEHTQTHTHTHTRAHICILSTSEVTLAHTHAHAFLIFMPLLKAC